MINNLDRHSQGGEPGLYVNHFSTWEKHLPKCTTQGVNSPYVNQSFKIKLLERKNNMFEPTQAANDTVPGHLYEQTRSLYDSMRLASPYGDLPPNPYEQTIKIDENGPIALPPPPPLLRRKW